MGYCDRCDRSYRGPYSDHALRSRSPNHNFCSDCDTDFWSYRGLKEHWVQSPAHYYCQYCDLHFDDDEELEVHYINEHAYCKECRRVFKNDNGLHEHRRQSELHRDRYCVSCKRLFTSENALKHHLNSKIHRPANIICPFGCGGTFISNPAFVAHCEKGGCSSGVTKHVVDKFVRKVDVHNNITRKMITGPSDADSETETTYIATGRSWNGYAYECLLCYQTFTKLHALNQHLRSPTHQAKIYVCRGSNCGSQFVALSGLMQHIESERCGVARFNPVRNVMDNMLGQFGNLRIGN